MDKIRIHHGKEFEAFELQTDEIPCKLIAAVFYQKNDEHRLVLAEAEKYASLFAAAPALLEALRAAKAQLTGVIIPMGAARPGTALNKVIVQIDTAIKKAEKEG